VIETSFGFQEVLLDSLIPYCYYYNNDVKFESGD